MFLRHQLVALFLVLMPLCGHAAEVLKVDKNQRLMAVTHTRERRWKQGDYLCVVKREKEVACGSTIKATSRGAIVRFDYQSGARVLAGDPVEFYLFPPENLRELPSLPKDAMAPGTDKESQSSPLPEIEVEKRMESAMETPPPAPPQEEESDTEEEEEEEEEESPAAAPSASPVPTAPPAATPTPTPTPSPTLAPTPSPEPVAVGPSAPVAEPTPAPADDWVDLDALDSAPPPPPPKPDPKAAKKAGGSPHASLGVKPKFRMLFDWLMAYRSFSKPHFTFDKYHTLLMFEIRPAPKLYFGFEVSGSPRYYELNYEVSRKFTLRAGKIAMPFDDLSPHSYFGGRINISRLTPPGSSAFLPDFWSDLGVAMRWRMIYTKSFEWALHVAVTNGFGEGGVNPVDASGLYPEFAQANGIQDNNRDKAFTVRTQMNFFGDKLAFGASAYRGRYSNQTSPSAFIHMFGIDAQARVGRAELRGGYVFMVVDTPGQISESFRRGGAYGEFGMYLDKRDQWRWSLRGGAVNHDSRVIMNSDQIIGGTQFSYRTGPVTIALEYDLDVHTFDGKPQNYMAGARVTFGM